MWKLINSGNAWLQPGAPYGRGEFKGNRFTPNGTQFMDPHNPCLPNGSASRAIAPYEGSFPPPPCVVCTNSTPCVFDVIADPLETKNLFGDPALPPGLVKNMSAKLASFAVYSPLKMTDGELGCYNCSATWGMFLGPRCVR